MKLDMHARILEKLEEQKWADFIQNHPFATIHQTPQWGHFQAEIPGRGKYWIVVLEDFQNKIIAGTLLIRHKLPKGYSWLYSPRGPLLNYDDQKIAATQMTALLEICKKISKEEKAIFLRIDPMQKQSFCTSQQSFAMPAGGVAEEKTLFPGFKPTSHGFQPQHTLILDLTKTEQELLSEMKPKGRYNIKIADQKGVKIRMSHMVGTTSTSADHVANSTSNHATTAPTPPTTSTPIHQPSRQFPDDLTNFYKIFQETTGRDGFHGHTQDYYEKMLKNLNSTHACLPSGTAALYLAEYDDKVIAGAIITYFKDTATYYFGASSNEYRNVMAPYLLHWQAIKDAKAQNYKLYDFFGIAPADSINHPWQGVTEFKKKFGGQEISYQPAQEFAFKKGIYRLYSIYKNLRKTH